MSKQFEYAGKILNKLAELFIEEEAGGSYINPKELEDDSNTTDLIHALANIAPASFYTELTGNEVNLIEFNHIANILCFQNMNLIDNEEDVDEQSESVKNINELLNK